ncbi:MAG TPA: PAS domain-containing hybrid sensor histidine kinase/response regulator [Stellaceae bacterium]|nr:PAS domain-containing hybrid sensor histidine kinase/response regulator [Stellaceae bacterium]
MLDSWAVLAFSLGYVGFLFAVAYYGDRQARRRGRPAGKPIIYALSLAVYCTSWTFYGSVGLAARTGYNFLPIYLGPVLMFALGWPLLRRVIRIAKAHNITSIADYIAARYGKSQRIASVVSVIAVIGTLPYIALQLKALSASFHVITHFPDIALPVATGTQPLWGDTALIISVIMAAFAILFGTRQIDATEHHEGMILAIAFESIVKLVAFLLVGAFVTWGMLSGIGGLSDRVAASPALSKLFLDGVDGTTWLTMTGLAFVAILCLPRQFHVTIVENASESDLKTATWLFPLYLLAINLFVVPISVAGLSSFSPGSVDGDMFVLALPMAAGQSTIALLVFIGGLSAATGMVIVASVAVSIMVSNDLVMPVLLRGQRGSRWAGDDMSATILHVRRVAILVFMLLAYCAYRLIGNSAALASIGLLSFAAMAQFAPALLGGMIWRRATASGVLAGLTAGAGVWAYTLLLPSLARSGWLPMAFVAGGPFGIGWLRPERLLGLRFDPLTHGVFWSLLANVTCYAAFSLRRIPRVIERIQANAFVDFDGEFHQPGERNWRGSIPVASLMALAAQYLGAERAQRSFADFTAQRGIALSSAALSDFPMIRHTERLLASAIGAPSARLVLALALERRNLSIDEAMALLDDATAAIQYNRDLLQSTLENVRQGISVFDKELRLVCWNRRFRDLLDLPLEFASVGVTLQQIIRFNADRGEYGSGDVEDLVAQRLDLFIGQGETIFERQRPNGRVLEIRTNPMAGGYVTTYSDITEHVRATAQLAAANEQLEQRVHDRTAALTSLNEALSRAKIVAEEANVGKTRFLAAASHDLLQPLNAARLYVSSLLEQQERDHGAELPLVRKIDASLHVVEELLGTLLDISRLDGGALKPEREDFALGELFELLKVEFAPLAERKKLSLRIVPTSLVVRTDRHFLHRILQNLLSNAIRYTQAGRVLLGVRRSEGDHHVIQVWDTGTGINPEHRGLVFQEFRRFATGPGSEHGLGLGLSIVDRISRILQHSIDFRSEVGRGTMFSVQVPRGRGPLLTASVEIPPARTPSKLEHALVLCIDNEASVLDGTKALLESWSCRVMLASGLREATTLAAAAATPPDILIVDYHLDRDGDGVDCVEALRRLCGRELPAVLVTADRSDAVRARAAAIGLAILHKPVKPAALRSLLMRLLAVRIAAE